MYLRALLALLLSVPLVACTSSGNVGLNTNFFEIVDTNGDGWVDLDEFRAQNLFFPYEEIFHELDDDGDGRLDSYQLQIAQSRIYHLMNPGVSL